MENDVILRFDSVSKLTGLGRTSIYSLMKLGEFPRGIKLGERAVGWSRAEVQQWIARQIARRDGKAAR